MTSPRGRLVSVWWGGPCKERASPPAGGCSAVRWPVSKPGGWPQNVGWEGSVPCLASSRGVGLALGAVPRELRLQYHPSRLRGKGR